MSLWTDVRDNIENQVGIGPDSNTAQTIADATVGASRAVGSLIKPPQTSQPAAPSAAAPVVQKVEAFATDNSKTLLIVGVGLLVVFFVVKRRRK